MSVISPFLPLMATEVRLNTEPLGLTLKVASRPFLTLRSTGGFAPLPSLVIFTVTVLAAESNLTHLPSLCVLLALASAASAAGAASRSATAASAKARGRVRIGIGSPPLWCGPPRAGDARPRGRTETQRLHALRRFRHAAIRSGADPH